MPPLMKERKKQCNMKLRHDSIINHSVTIIIIDTRLQKKKRTRNGQKQSKQIFKNLQMHNGKYQHHTAASCTYQLISQLLNKSHTKR